MPTSPLDYSVLALIGLAAGALGGLLGIGGSIIMIPALAIFLGDDQHLYQAAAMVVNIAVALPAAIRHKRAGALRDFLNNVLGPNDDIAHFEYTKKHNRDTGPALVGIEVRERRDYEALLQRMNEQHIDYQTLNDSRMLFELLI